MSPPFHSFSTFTLVLSTTVLVNVAVLSVRLSCTVRVPSPLSSTVTFTSVMALS